MNDYSSAQDLFGRFHLVRDGKPLNERATLIQYFSGEIRRNPKLLAIRTAHYTLDQLYALRSGYVDRKRESLSKAQKWFWYITRTKG